MRARACGFWELNFSPKPHPNPTFLTYKKLYFTIKEIELENQMQSLLVLFSYHHKNTEKIAKVIAKVLDAQIRMPQQINTKKLQEYNLIGFGSGIYDGKHHKVILEFVDKLPQVTNKKAFIFSTSGVTKKNQQKIHLPLLEKLQTKGYMIVDEFNCAGFNTNSFLRRFGGINKGRPNAEDLEHAKEFAQNLNQNLHKR